MTKICLAFVLDPQCNVIGFGGGVRTAKSVSIQRIKWPWSFGLDRCGVFGGGGGISVFVEVITRSFMFFPFFLFLFCFLSSLFNMEINR